jgi:hypothetical protein
MHPLHDVPCSLTALHRDDDRGPTHHLDMKGGNVGDLAFSNGDEARSLRSGLANVPSLEIAGEHHVRPLVEDGALMNVAQGPVVVALIDKVIEGTRCIVGMPPMPPRAVCRTPMLKLLSSGSG